MKTNVRLKKNYNEFYSVSSELSSGADVIALLEAWLSVNTCQDVQDYTAVHSFPPGKYNRRRSLCVY